MKKILLLATALFLLMAPFQASAFDNDRKGFMLNLGLGFGQGKISASTGGLSASTDAIGFGTDLKIGAGLNNNKVLIYYTNRVLWYSPEIVVGDTRLDGNLINGMSAVGVSYFLEPEVPSLFFSGALGIGVHYDSDAEDSLTGFGFTLGIGFEFARHFIAELTYMHAGVSFEEDIPGVDPSISNIMLSVSWLAY